MAFDEEVITFCCMSVGPRRGNIHVPVQGGKTLSEPHQLFDPSRYRFCQ